MAGNDFGISGANLIPLEGGAFANSGGGLDTLQKLTQMVPGIVAMRKFRAEQAAAQDYRRSIGPNGQINPNALGGYLRHDAGAALAAPQMSQSALANQHAAIANETSQLGLNIGRMTAASNALLSLSSQKGLTRQQAIEKLGEVGKTLGLPQDSLNTYYKTLPNDPEKLPQFLYNEGRLLSNSVKTLEATHPQVVGQDTGGGITYFVHNPLNGEQTKVGFMAKTMAPHTATVYKGNQPTLTQVGGAGAPGQGQGESTSPMLDLGDRNMAPAWEPQGAAPAPSGGSISGGSPGEGNFASAQGLPKELVPPGYGKLTVEPAPPSATPGGSGTPLGNAGLASGEAEEMNAWGQKIAAFPDMRRTALQRVSTINQAQAALPNANTGTLSGSVTWLGGIAKELGLTPPGGSISSTQELNKYLSQLLTQATNAVPGARDLTDYKLNLVVQANPHGALTKEAIGNMLGYLKGVEQYQAALPLAWNEFAHAHGMDPNNPAGYQEFMDGIGSQLNPAAFQFMNLDAKAKSAFLRSLKAPGKSLADSPRFQSFARSWNLAKEFEGSVPQ